MSCQESEWHCRFQAILSIQEGVSVFKVVETNDFNQLPHITLAFRPGNDAAVKAFLASRLSEVQTSHERLRGDLSRAEVSPTPIICLLQQSQAQCGCSR